MAKVEIERASLVGAVLIALSATLAIGLNAYSRLHVADQKHSMPETTPNALSEEVLPCVAGGANASDCEPQKPPVDNR